MKFDRRVALSLPTLLLAGAFRPAPGRAEEAYPNHPVTIVVPYAPGGSGDLVGRLVAKSLSERLKQSFVVENRSGAAGTVGHASVARARPDGYTLLVTANSTYVMAPLLYPSLPYNSDTAFVPITLIGRTAQVLCVNPSVPVREIGALVALLKQRPDGMNYSTSGIAGTSHLATEMFLSMTGTSMTHVPYRGGGPSAQALIAGEVEFSFVDIATALPLIADNRVRALGVSSPERSPLAPTLPAIAEELPGFESSTDFAFLAPAGIPRSVQELLVEQTRGALHEASLRGQLEQQGIQVVGGTPKEFVAYRQEAIARWGAVVRERNIRPPN